MLYPHTFYRRVGILDPLPSLLVSLIFPLARMGIFKIYNLILRELKVGEVYNLRSALASCHSELQINHKRKSFFKCYSRKHKEVRSPNLKTREYDTVSPYAAIEIIVSPGELRELESHMDDLTIGFSCADQTISYLNKAIKENLVPYPIRLSPLLSSIYLLAKKLLGSKRVGNLEVRAKGRDFWRLFSPEMIGEILMCDYLSRAFLSFFQRFINLYLKSWSSR
ncbi:MAG: hypothetical protein JSS09_08105 [Verrucomicrobia bacterium]|nr:hypothetical protein [Verrucomicrobiota bacterium]